MWFKEKTAEVSGRDKEMKQRTRRKLESLECANLLTFSFVQDKLRLAFVKRGNRIMSIDICVFCVLYEAVFASCPDDDTRNAKNVIIENSILRSTKESADVNDHLVDLKD